MHNYKNRSLSPPYTPSTCTSTTTTTTTTNTITFRITSNTRAKMKQQFSLFSFSLLLILFLHVTKTLAQSPPAAAPPQPPPAVQPPPAPAALSPGSAQVPATTSGTPDVDKILTKAGHFTILVRLLKATQEDGEIFSELNTTTNGVTVFAPNDGAFSALQVGTLNTLSDGEKTLLVKFHILPKFISASQFQTESNPVKTKAGTGVRDSLNVTVTGTSVNITTGLTNTSIIGTVYTDNQLAVYQIDKVLLPMNIFGPKQAPAPAPAPAEGKPKKQAASATSTSEAPTAPKDNTSGSMSLTLQSSKMVFAVGIVAACSVLVAM